MTDSETKQETKEVKECSCDSTETKEMKDCPDDKKVDGKCPETEKQEAIPSWAKSLSDNVAKIQTDYSSLSGKLEALKKVEVEAGVREAPKPTATVSNEDSGPTMSLQRATEKVAEWLDGNRDVPCSIIVDHDQLRSFVVQKVRSSDGVRESYINSLDRDNRIKEALTFTGTHTNAQTDGDVLLEPSSKNFEPIGQFAILKEPAKGQTSARYNKAGVPTELSQTPGTTATQGTIDLEAVDITPSTITGNRFLVDSDDIENDPVDLVSLVVRNSALNYEDFVATDMLTTISAEGTLTPGLWLNAETGATITHSDNSGITMEPLGIATAKAYLAKTGYLRAGVKPICVMHQDQHKELLTSSNLTSYVQQGDASITRNGDITELYGVRIVQCNAIENKDNTTTDAYNALMFIPQHSYGLAIKRRIKVSFHDKPEDNQIDVVNNWRAKTGAVDATSIVRMSSSSPTI